MGQLDTAQDLTYEIKAKIGSLDYVSFFVYLSIQTEPVVNTAPSLETTPSDIEMWEGDTEVLNLGTVIDDQGDSTEIIWGTVPGFASKQGSYLLLTP